MMFFNMTDAGIVSNNVFNQTKIVMSQPLSKTSQTQHKVFIPKNKPTFSLSSSSKNKNIDRNKITRNGQ